MGRGRFSGVAVTWEMDENRRYNIYRRHDTTHQQLQTKCQDVV
jgi:hypothetical protein